MEMGVFPELGPGGLPGPGRGLGLADLVDGSRRPKVVYLVGDIPFFDRPDCDFLIVQDTYLPPFKVDAFLPASTFAEAGGSLVNMEGRVQEIVRIEDLPEGVVTGFMRPDWRIFSDLALALKCETMNYETAKDVLKDIRTAVPDFPARINRKPRRMKAIDHLKMDPASNGRAAEGEFLLVAEPGGYRHRGIDISSKVGGLAELGLEEGYRMNPEDIDSLGLKNGDCLTLSFDNGKISATNAVKSDIECPKGVIYYTRPVVLGGLKHRRELWPLYNLKQNPIRVNASRAAAEKR
jgi:anaerobic selenocysteine-containing dehydrogenase